MKNRLAVAVVATVIAFGGTAAESPESDLAYSADGRVQPPADYREWIYVTSGYDMSYRQHAADDPMHQFDNVFVKPSAYRSFQATGTWPDKTVLVLEVRGATGRGSINQSGAFQTPERMGLEMHVKDTARFAGGWAFFSQDSDGLATQLPAKADCYSCHRDHAAVDTTFVQFYPTLLPVAQRAGTLSAAYATEHAAEVSGK